MDETAVWADMPGNSIIEVRGAHTVQIATTGHDKQRITICLAAFADLTQHSLALIGFCLGSKQCLTL